MKLKLIALKYLAILVLIELLLDILVLASGQAASFSINPWVFFLVRPVVFVLLLIDLYKSKATFGVAALTLLFYPIFIQLIQVGLGNIFIHFCPQQAGHSGQTGLLRLISEFESKSCFFPTRFQLSFYIENPVSFLKRFFATYRLCYLWQFLFSPYVVYLFLFFKFCLFKLFGQNSKNPYLALIPVVNKVVLLDICKLPATWIWILLVPFVRLFWLYKINRRLCRVYGVNESNAIGATVLPSVFYGIFVFRQQTGNEGSGN